MDQELLGSQVRQRRMKEGLSQEELARQAGISRTYLSQIERGVATNLSWQLVDTLTTLLGLKFDGVMGDLPQGLAEFALQAQLPADDITMLARLQYRGQQPKTAKDWELLFNVIKAAIRSAQ